jgi:hypothetical protein
LQARVVLHVGDVERAIADKRIVQVF